MVLNCFVQVHTKRWSMKGIIPEISDTFKVLVAYGGEDYKSAEFASKLLTAIFKTLTHTRFPDQDFHETLEWPNLNELLDLTKKFVFLTAHWQYRHKTDKEEEEDEIFDEMFEHEDEEDVEWEGQYENMMDEHEETLGDMEEKFANAGFFLNTKKIEYMLTKQKKKQETTSWDREVVEPTDYGIHWTRDGELPLDLPLVQSIIDLMKKLKIEKFDPELDGFNMNKKDIAHYKEWKKKLKFWNDARDFIKLVKRTDIDVEKTMTWRKMSHVTQRFWECTSSKERKGLVVKWNRSFTKKKAKRKAAA